MALLCFLLDLRNIPPPLLRDLKQCLLQLANYYAISQGKQSSSSSPFLPDRFGLAYIHIKSPSSSPELKIAYRPGDKFCLRDFHHAVNKVPQDSFLREFRDPNNSTENQDISLANLFSNKALYAWCNDDVSKKVIAICISPFNDTESLRRSLVDAAEQCVSVEFVILESAYIAPSEDIITFFNKFCDLENCVTRRYIPDMPVLYGIFKRWLEELKDETEDPLQVIFLFKNSIFGHINQITCNLVPTTDPIMDDFSSCRACRCHGHPACTGTSTDKSKKWCQITSRELGFPDLIENAIRVSKHDILFLPSFEGGSNTKRIASPISFNVIERTSLASLDEGVIIGGSYIVAPTNLEDEASLDDRNTPDQNMQIFQGLNGALFNLEQGLICSSKCNTETMRNGSFLCYYILLPSENGPMLLRRLAGSEEILPLPDTNPNSVSSIPLEMEASIQDSLSKIDVKVYNPLEHERGFHTKLNWLVKESLQFGSIAPIRPQTIPKPNNSLHSIPPNPSPRPQISSQKENKTPQSCIAEEWEQLVILDKPKKTKTPSPNLNLNLKSRIQNPRVLSQNKPVDEKTTRILERLEAPKAKRQQKTGSMPPVPVGTVGKKPLLPFNSNSNLSQIQSQPIKPSFQRSRKKPKT
ncbi:hypothetical protein LUZ60_013378 [Juncus effusus]|nr:hypothetical protein LUZ60_013378 [Juncus effusus]